MLFPEDLLDKLLHYITVSPFEVHVNAKLYFM